MPSTHSASITYFASELGFSCVIRLMLNPRVAYIPLACAYLPLHRSLPQSSYTRLLPPILIVPCASLIAVSRIWLGHHTVAQVLVGAGCGAAFACVWFKGWAGGAQPYAAALESFVNSYI